MYIEHPKYWWNKRMLEISKLHPRHKEEKQKTKEDHTQRQIIKKN